MNNPTSPSEPDEIRGMHCMLEALQHMDVGLVLVDRSCCVRMWNQFMQNHSGRLAEEAIGQNLFALCPEIPKAWFQGKIDAVFLLENRHFITWEQRPWVFRFGSPRPITGTAEYMYQNLTLIPLQGPSGSIEQVCIAVYDVTEVALNRQALSRANEQLERLSQTDRLTGLHNRGHWEEQLFREFQRCRRTGEPSTLLLFDIDHFKPFNDTHGHVAGDAMLREVGRVVQHDLRSIDIAGRYGGEEFALILVNADERGARDLAERLRERIANTTIDYDGQPLSCTISAGLAALSEQDRTAQEWVERADAALYQAKAQGRNQVVIAPAPPRKAGARASPL